MKSVLLIFLTAVAVFVLAPSCFSVEDEKGHICFNTIDSNRDNGITFEEFVKYLRDDRERFTSVDQNKDGNSPMRNIMATGGLGARTRNRLMYTRPLKNAPFCPISTSGSNSSPRNTQGIPVVRIFAFFDLEQN